jgi:hypothetical protein
MSVRTAAWWRGRTWAARLAPAEHPARSRPVTRRDGVPPGATRAARAA